MKINTLSEFDSRVVENGGLMGNIPKSMLEARIKELSEKFGRNFSEDEALRFMFGDDIVYSDFFSFVVFTR